MRTYNDQYGPASSDSDQPATLDPSESDGQDDDFLEAVFDSQSSALSFNAPSEIEVYLEEPVAGRKVFSPIVSVY